jgi:protein-S-isoprenylcysteine O-methyltransferase Ste14
MQTLALALRALVYMTAFIWFFGWLANGVRSYDSRFSFGLPAWLQVPGLVLIAAGGLLLLTCAGYFVVQGQGTPAVFDAPRQFVATGPYRFVRNPMYVGALGLLAGFGLWLRSISILLLAAALFGIVHLFVLFYEEPTLEKRFGQSYVDYKKAVHRWVPKWPFTHAPHNFGNHL